MTMKRLGLAVLLALTIAAVVAANTVATRYNLSTPTALASGDTWIEGAGTAATLYTYHTATTYTLARASMLVTPVTTTAAPSAAATRVVYTNEGDLDGATVTLPAAAAGPNVTKATIDAQLAAEGFNGE